MCDRRDQCSSAFGTPSGATLTQGALITVKSTLAAMLKIVGGVVLAIALALVLADASIGGIAVWKIALAAMGLVLFILGGRTSNR